MALGYLWLPLGSQVIPQVILDLGLGHILGQPGVYPVTFSVYIAFFLLGTLAILKVGETRPRNRVLPALVGP